MSEYSAFYLKCKNSKVWMQYEKVNFSNRAFIVVQLMYE